MHSSSSQAGMVMADGGLRVCSVLCTLLRGSRLFRPSRGIRRYAQDELAFRDPHAVYAGIDFKLHQVVHLRQSFGAKIDLFPGPDGTKEFHAPDRGKKK